MGLKALEILALELLSINDAKRLVTGKDPVTDEKANRLTAVASLGLDALGGIGKVGDVVKVAKAIDKLDDVADAAKALDKLNDVQDVAKTADKADDLADTAKTVDKVDDVGKGVKGSQQLSELPENVQDAYKGYDNVDWKGNYKGQTSGTGAGAKFENDDLYLPEVDSKGNTITYKEYDVNSKANNLPRDKERFVRGSDGAVYYTNDHYKTFTKIK